MRFELLIALTVMNIIIWDVTPCSLIDIDQHFGESSPSSPSAQNMKMVGLFKMLVYFYFCQTM